MKNDWLKAILLVLVLLFAGCTSKFAYNNIDWMMYWYIDDYLDLDKQQKGILDAKVDKWHAWHRSEELKMYRQHLLDLKQSIAHGDVSEEQWLAHLERGSDHWARFRDHISPELVEMSVHLTDQQINRMFEELEDGNLEEIEERQEKTEQQRWEDNREQSKEQFERWAGRLTDQQKELIDTYSDQYQSTFDQWIVYRRLIQSRTKELLLQRNELSDYQSQLNDVIANPEAFRSAEYIQARAHNRQVFAAMLAEVSDSFTDKQKRHIYEEVDDLVDDITDLIED